MGIRIAERPERIVVFLAGGIPECQLDVLTINFDICNIVFEYGGHIDLGNRMSGVAC